MWKTIFLQKGWNFYLNSINISLLFIFHFVQSLLDLFRFNRGFFVYVLPWSFFFHFTPWVIRPNFQPIGNTAFQPFVSPGLAVQSLPCAARSSSNYIIAIQAETSSVTQCNSSIDERGNSWEFFGLPKTAQFPRHLDYASVNRYVSLREEKSYDAMTILTFSKIA